MEGNLNCLMASRIPENTTDLLRFATGLLLSFNKVWHINVVQGTLMFLS